MASGSAVMGFGLRGHPWKRWTTACVVALAFALGSVGGADAGEVKENKGRRLRRRFVGYGILPAGALILVANMAPKTFAVLRANRTETLLGLAAGLAVGWVEAGGRRLHKVVGHTPKWIKSLGGMATVGKLTLCAAGLFGVPAVTEAGGLEHLLADTPEMIRTAAEVVGPHWNRIVRFGTAGVVGYTAARSAESEMR